MLNLMKKLRAGPETSAAIREALAEVEAATPGAADALAQAEATRGRLLLMGSDAEVERIEASASRARISLDRLYAARAELGRRLAEAEASEATAAIDAERAMVEARAAKLASRLRPEYEKHAAALVSLLGDLASVEDQVKAVNRKLAEAGRDDALDAIETRALRAGSNLADLVSVRALTSLRPVGACPGWGAGRQTAQMLGLEV